MNTAAQTEKNISKEFQCYELRGWMYECDVQHWCELSDWIEYDLSNQVVSTECGVRIKVLYFDTDWTGDDELQFQYYCVISGDEETVKRVISEVFKQDGLLEINDEDELEYAQDLYRISLEHIA